MKGGTRKEEGGREDDEKRGREISGEREERGGKGGRCGRKRIISRMRQEL